MNAHDRVPVAPFLDVDEMAEFLRVPKKTLYHWVHRREIPFTKVGRHLRFIPVDVVEFFRRQTPQSPCYDGFSLIQDPLRSLTTGKGSHGGTRKE